MQKNSLLLVVLVLLALVPSTVKATCPDCFFTQVCGGFRMSNWINRVAPNNIGDWELVSLAYSQGGCVNPLSIEC
jgi:hypothetical protein